MSPGTRMACCTAMTRISENSIAHDGMKATFPRRLRAAPHGPPRPRAIEASPREGRQDAAPDGSLLLTGWLVGAAKLARSLPNALNLLHREEARQPDVLDT